MLAYQPAASPAVLSTKAGSGTVAQPQVRAFVRLLATKDSRTTVAAFACVAAPLVAGRRGVRANRSRCQAIQDAAPQIAQVQSPVIAAALPMKAAPMFDPLGLAKDEQTFRHGRSMEIVMGRLAMLAAIGLPMAEMHHETVAEVLNVPTLLADGNRAPSIVNGSAFGAVPEALSFAIICACGFGVAEIMKGKEKDNMIAPGFMAQPGLSPLVSSLLSQAELHNGRFAMLGVVLMGMMEAMGSRGVVEMTPELFGLPRQ